MDVITEMIMAVKKNGRIAIVGDYFGCGHAFPIGPFMEKSLVMKGGQTFVQKYVLCRVVFLCVLLLKMYSLIRYWKELLGYIEKGQFDPTFVITHHLTLEDAPTAYKLMNNHEDNFIKAILHVDWETHTEGSPSALSYGREGAWSSSTSAGVKGKPGSTSTL